MSITLLLPAYNEAETLPHLFWRIQTLKDELPPLRLLIVDHGSTDGTANLAEQYAGAYSWVSVIHHPQNLGLARALRTGIGEAVEMMQPGDVLVTMDADDTHDPAEILAMLSRMTEADLVIASRFCPTGSTVGLNWLRTLLSNGAGWFLSASCPLPGVSDYSSGFRAYRFDLLRRLLNAYPELVKGRGFECTPELLLQAATVGARVTEVPMVLHSDRKRRKSHMPFLRTIGGYFRLALRYGGYLRRMRPIRERKEEALRT